MLHRRWRAGGPLLCCLLLLAVSRSWQLEVEDELEGVASKPGVCSDECYAVATCNEEVGGRCDCPKTLTGKDCHRKAPAGHQAAFGQAASREQRMPFPCLNNCTGRGKCVYGGCVCTRGNFGSDCSSSMDPETGTPVVLAGMDYKPREKRPLIYVYDIPHKYSSWFNVMKIDRGLPWVFWERLAGSGVLTANGDEADWFWIPVKLRTTTDGYRLLETIKYVREHWPWFDKYNGSRHFVIHSGDTGRGEVTGAVRDAPQTANITWLHHWGLTEDYPTSGWRKAHRVGKDVVVPIYFGGKQGHGYVPLSGLHPRAPRLPRSQTMLFSGRICGDHSQPDPNKPWPHCASEKSNGYSQGVRQQVHYHHHNRTGYKIVVSNKEYPVDLLNYKWCLAPSGGGHGHRQVLVAAMGCLPVVVSDVVMQPFEPEMDWSAFGLRVAQKDIPTLHEAIEAVDEETYQRMQDALLCATQHMIFSTLGGAFMQEDGRWDAFEFVLEILRMQLQYPGLDPSKYGDTDEQYRNFLHCGDPDGMASYGSKLRQQQHAKYPATETLTEGREMTWDDLYERQGTGLKQLLDRNRLTPKGEPEEEALPLCSMSMWDVEPLRCGKHKARSGVSHCYIPGGAACVTHSDDLGKCPRLWT